MELKIYEIGYYKIKNTIRTFYAYVVMVTMLLMSIDIPLLTKNIISPIFIFLGFTIGKLSIVYYEEKYKVE